MPKKNNSAAIMAASQKLFFHRDYSSVSMSDIARSAKMTKAALYYHFASKTDLFLRVLEVNLAHFRKQIGETINSPLFEKKELREKVEDLLSAYFDFFDKHNSIIKFLVKRISGDNKKILSFLTRARQEIIDTLKPFSEEMLKQKKNRALTHQDMTMFFFGMINPFLHERLADKEKISAKEMANKICSILID